MARFIEYMSEFNTVTVLTRLIIAALVGGIIGTERGRHGRAAGLRTHILICLGAAITSLTSLYLSEVLGYSSDIARLSAQVISGIGFLGAGMIIIKNNNVITGLTTAAGVWTTSVIGIAVGFGFYEGAIVVTALFLIAIIFFAKLERRKKAAEIIYVEIDDMYKANEIVAQMAQLLEVRFNHRMMAPKSGLSGNLGITVIIDRRLDVDIMRIKELDHVVFVEEES